MNPPLKTSHGLIQGYEWVTAADGKHQVTFYAEAFGQGRGHNLLMLMVHGVRENFKAIGKERNLFEAASLLHRAQHEEDPRL